MRKLQLILASAAAALATPSPVQAQAQDDGPPGLRAFFSGTAADGTLFSGMLFYIGSSVQGSFITLTSNGQQVTLPIAVGEADGPVSLPPTPTNGTANFVGGFNFPTTYAIFSVSNISGQIGNTYVGVSPQVADILNGGYATAGYISPGFSFGGPVNYHFDYAPAFPEPATWAMMLLGFGVIGFALRRQRPSAHIATTQRQLSTHFGL
jgi:hypothetical protein